MKVHTFSFKTPIFSPSWLPRTLEASWKPLVSKWGGTPEMFGAAVKATVPPILYLVFVLFLRQKFTYC